MNYILSSLLIIALIVVCCDYGLIKNKKVITLLQTKNIPPTLVLVGVGILLFQSILWLKTGSWQSLVAHQLLPTDLETLLLYKIATWEWKGVAQILNYVVSIPAYLFTFVSAFVISFFIQNE